MPHPTGHHPSTVRRDPTWPYEDVDFWELVASEPRWACAAGFCACHPSPDAAETRASFSVLLRDERGARMRGARCRILADGVLLNEHDPHADAEGWIQVKSPRLPEQVLVEWAPALTPPDPKLPFRKLYHVDLAPGDPREAARRRLHNLGHSEHPSLRENILAFQRAHRQHETGLLRDVEEPLTAFHDRGVIPSRKDSAFSLVNAVTEEQDPGGGPPAGPSGSAGAQGAPQPRPTFRERLEEAVSRLTSIGFGRAELDLDLKDDQGEVIGTWVGYSTEHWSVEPDPDYTLMLSMVKDGIPSAALRSFFVDPKRWHVDCSQFTQLVLLYARWKRVGDAAFDRKLRTRFHLRIFDSSGINPGIVYKRRTPDETMYHLHSGKKVSESADEILARTPVGSRVMWTNLDAPKNSPFRNENTVKLADDLFAAHGFGDQKRWSRVALERALAKITRPDADEAYIKKTVFLAQIEHYATPP